MKNPTQHLIAEVRRSASKVKMTIGIDLGDVWRINRGPVETGDLA